MQTSIDLDFADGVYTFRLPLPQVDELQRKTGIGIGGLYARVLRGQYVTPDGGKFGLPLEAEFRLEDLRETIRQGLIGGRQGIVDGVDVEVTPALVRSLMDAYVYPAQPMVEAWKLATAILSACVDGYEDPDQKKTPDGPASESASEEPGETMDGSTGPAPSAPSQQWDIPSGMLTP
jgi:hypothetical protein